MGYDGTLTVRADGRTTDLTPKELLVVQKYKENGMPGIASLGDVVTTKALDLYLSGKTYHEISTITRTKKDIILYVADKFNWYQTKIEHLEILDASLKERILHARLVNQDFVLQIQQFFLAKIGRKMTRYLATGDDAIAAEVDGKDIDRYQKSVELLEKLISEKTPMNSRGPTIGLNLGDGVNVRKVGENEVIITPRNKTVGEMIAEMANIKRQQESEALHDISNDTTETEGNE